MYTGYCTVHDICTVFVFETEYADRRSVRDNLPRAIREEFGIDCASFDFAVHRAESPEGENIWELAEEAARDSVGDYGGFETVSEYKLHGDVVEISKRGRAVAREAASEYGVAPEFAQALLDAACLVYGAHEEREVAPEFAEMLQNMTAYYR